MRDSNRFAPWGALVAGAALLVVSAVALASEVTPEETENAGTVQAHVTMNDPASRADGKPVIVDLDILPSKFARVCDRVELVAEARDPDGDILTYEWQITAGDGAALSSDGHRARFAAGAKGAYKVRLTVRDPGGGQASLAFPVHVTGDGEACRPSEVVRR